MMEGVIIAVIVGLLSGLLGAVIGPVVTHRLSRRQREEQRTEQRHAELRAMLEGQMGAVHHSMFGIISYWAQVEGIIGAPIAPTVAMEEHLKAEADMIASRRPWQPYRLDDDSLKGLAARLDDMANKLGGHLGRMRETPDQDVNEWYMRSVPWVGELNKLTEEIHLRLDELNW